MGCFCTPFDPGQAGQILQDAEQMAASGLVFALQQAQADATALGTEPIPLHIRVQLDAWYDFAVLDAVRFRVGDQQQVSAANALLQNPDVNAVTLIDTVIFRHASDAENNVALWAHELKHVQQYQELGVSEFARRYTRNYNELEARPTRSRPRWRLRCAKSSLVRRADHAAPTGRENSILAPLPPLDLPA